VTGSKHVIVITGAGGMGSAIARRIGAGATVVIADVNEQALAVETAALAAVGLDVVGRVVDVASADSVDALTDDATARGPVTAVVHTAGVSPVQASVDAIMRVDLVGTARMLDAFGAVISAGGAGVFITSMAGTMTALDPAFERNLATTATDQLLDLPELAPGVVADSGTAYGIAKRANQLRVRTASVAWGRRSARVNSISPGVIATPMGAAELDGPHGDIMRAMIRGSGTGRIGTPDDIAAAVAFLLGHDASFITGTDLLVDGGVVASLLA
jgi:NAD(P)-dependent dehydrogenase (short-subunit alcohol dehydrogenase family)